jgi:hypothetical protein
MDDSFIEHWYVKHKQTILIVLFIVAKVYQFPYTVIASEEACAEFFPLY